MRTLQLGMNWYPEVAGGLSRVYYDCMRSLPEAGVEFEGLVAGSPTVAQQSGGRVHAFAGVHDPLRSRWSQLRQTVRQRLKQREYDLVVSHFALYAFPVLDLVSPYPKVMHFQGPWALESRLEGGKRWRIWLAKQLEQSCYRQVDRFIVLSEAFQEILHREYGVPIAQIHVVPPGIDLDRFHCPMSRSAARSQLGWPQDRPILLAVRRLVNRMGLENLIAAIDKVRHSHPDVLLLIAGRGPIQAALAQQIADLGLADHVRLLGFLPDADLPIAYRAANFSIVPTVALEGFGLIVVESLAAGTPVLGTPVCAIPEILRPLSEDLLLPGTAPEQIAQGIREALAGDRVIPSESDCQAYARSRYHWPRIAQQIKSVYQRAIEG